MNFKQEMKASPFGKYLKSNVCCIRNKNFNPNAKNLIKVHHCHFSGRYREAVHSICNLRCLVPH